MSYEDDHKIAFKLQKKFEQEEKRKRTAKTSKEFEKQVKPQEISNGVSIIDKSLEYIDPNPDIHALFIHFNDVYFWKKLLSVEVRWSPRMTSCAGVCCYEGRGRLCSIRLSLPLLKLRPRKDLVETLLHEMIHAYLFVTNNNRDRDGHGPEFHKHMNRINKSAGTKITVYHSFHDEVRSYQQHWWKCDGPCRNRPPYFGMVRRAMNRAPGPSDFWWSDHQASCGGKYVKIREPEGYNAGKKQSKGGAGSITKGKGKLTALKSLSNTPKAKPNISKIKSHMPKPSSPKSKPSVASGNDSISKPGILNFFTPTKPQQISGLSEPGNGLRKVAGAVKGPLQKESSSSSEKTITNSFMPFSGEGHVLGGKGGRILGSKRESAAAARAPPIKQPKMSTAFPTNWGATSISSSPSPVSRVNGSISESKEGSPTVECPACGKQQIADKINEHLDECLASSGKEGESIHTLPEITSSGERWLLECPGCRIKVEEKNFDDHLNQCEKLLNGKSEMGGSGEGTSELDDDDSDIVVLENEKCVCPACGVSVASFLIGEHLETCLSSLCFEEDDE